jgi:hypothetical protein
MTRRAKLKLNPEDKPTEKEPLTFEADEEESEPQATANDQPDSVNASEADSNKSSTDTTGVTPNTYSWLNRKTLFKAALAVGATAIAIYLIKRRLK